MNSLILIAVVGILGSFLLCWIQRTAVLRAWEISVSRAAVLSSAHAPADGWLAAMNARNHQGVLGGSRCAAQARTNTSPRPRGTAGVDE